MSSNTNNTQDRKDFERFTKFFVFKSVQIIVQSRLGEKIRTKSSATASGTDWFNLTINDNTDVQAEAKKALLGQPSILNQNVCIEISLRTAEGDSMILETWSITLDSNQHDDKPRAGYTIYNRMSLALRSLLSVSRVTPAYRLSRRQGTCAGDYVICYRIYLGEPQVFFLGDGYQKAKVGTVPTACGTISITVAYRTKLLISPQKMGKDLPFEVKDDHFKQDSSPKRPTTPKPCSLGYRRGSTADTDGSVLSEDMCTTTFSTSPIDPVNQQKAGLMLSHHHSQPIKIEKENCSPDQEEGKDFRVQSAPEKQSNFRDFHRVGAFVQHPAKDIKEVDDVPFLSLLQVRPEHLKQGRQDSLKLEVSRNTSSSKTESSKTDNSDSACSESKTSISSQTSATDDFVMVELKTPFAGADANSDLGKFYRECQGAPSLTLCEDEVTVVDTFDKLTTQLDVFETNMKDFDEFVTTLQESGESAST